MIGEEKILKAARILAEAAGPAKVILFGSYARGDATEDSDLDFLVIEKNVENQREEMSRLQKTLYPLEIYADILVYSEAEAEGKKNWCSTALYWALRAGKVLHDTTIG